ncbi:MAG: flagellar motor switch phosphatase FliY [Bacteroides sp.]
MDNMLSQDEINALLNGMDLSDNKPKETPQEEPIDESLLSSMERDAIGEIANISMGSSATTLYSLVNRKVNITTPVVTLAHWKNVLDEYEKPCVFIQIKYTKGLDGTNILVLRDHDVKIITDLMMGGDGTNTDGELGELHLSAISEAMNQMMGSASTSLSTMLDKTIDISPPESSLIDLTEYHSGSDIAPFLGGTFVKIAFRMQIGDLVDSTIMQLYPIEFAKSIVKNFLHQNTEEPAAAAAPASAPAPAPAPAPQEAPQPTYQQAAPQPMYQQAAPQPMMQQAAQAYVPPQMSMPQQAAPQQNVNIQPAQFQTLTNDYAGVAGNQNIGLIMDVPLEVTVELGRTKKSISEILDFAPGTIIELDRIAGEPIDVLVNGKFVAKGEVVVIEESFGVRVTEIIK